MHIRVLVLRIFSTIVQQVTQTSLVCLCTTDTVVLFYGAKWLVKGDVYSSLYQY